MTLWRRLHHMLASDGGVQSIATLPLDRFPTEAAAAVIGVLALWGLSQLRVGLVQLAVLLRFPALIPLLVLLVTGEYSLRPALMATRPIPLDGVAPGSVLNLPMIAPGLCLAVAACVLPRRG